MSCLYCSKRLNLLPGPNQDEIKPVGLKKGLKYGIIPGVYHLECYLKATGKQPSGGVVCDGMATCKVPE